MKPFSLSVLSLLTALAATADVVMVNGTIYDVGKGYKPFNTSSDVNIDREDKALCWAAAASNVIQHWQDRYLSQYSGVSAPNGKNSNNYVEPTGTQYLQIYDTFREYFFNGGGNFGDAALWYFNGAGPTTGWSPGTAPIKTDLVDTGGYFAGRGISAEGKAYNTADKPYYFKGLDGLKSVLDKPFQQQGFAVSMSIAPSPNGGGHAVTCWGYETDDAGNLRALYITDSDDSQFGARRMETRVDDEGRVHLYGENPQGSYGDGSYMVFAVNYITASTAVTKTANNSLSSALAGATGASVSLTTATEAKGTISTGKGIALEEGSMLISSGKANNTSVTINRASGVGLAAKLGSLLDIREADLTITNSTGAGLTVSTEAYVDNGNVNISGNGGAGVSVTNTLSDYKVYLEFDGNESVLVGGNKDRGIYCGGSADSQLYKDRPAQIGISNNASVEISGNETSNKRGAGIAVSGIADFNYNTNLVISGNKSTRSNMWSDVDGGGLAVLREGNMYGTSVGKVTISHNNFVTFDKNEAGGAGGAAYVSGSLTISDNGVVTFSGNKATASGYGGGALAAMGGQYSGGLVSISGNDKVVFDGNSSVAAGSAILASGKKVTLSGNGVVEFTNNTGGNGSVIRNDANSIVEIAHNDSVKFSGNEGTADISNNGTFYVSADAGQSITFEHGIQNDTNGITYLGKDSAGTVSTGGTYTFTAGSGSATMENLGTTVAAIGNSGGMEYAEGLLTVSKTEFTNTNLKYTMESSSLKLSEVTFTGDAALEVNLGYFGQGNFLWMDQVTGSNVSLSLLIDLVSEKTIQQTFKLDDSTQSLGTEISVLSARQEATLFLEDYFELTNPNVALLDIEVILSGMFADGSPLIIDTGNTGISHDQIVATGYTYDREEIQASGGSLVYYIAQEIPEPATATLSLLALAGLCARRRRKAA